MMTIPARTEDLYRSMSIPELTILREAFLLDLQTISDAGDRDFVQRRIALIVGVLAEKGIRPRPQ